MDDLEERVVRRIVDLLGPMLEARSPARGREDPREAPQGPYKRAPELVGRREELTASELVASSTQVEESVPEEILESGGHHDRFYGHGEAPLRPEELGAPAASLMSREVAGIWASCRVTSARLLHR
jgi:hypothetical protein